MKKITVKRASVTTGTQPSLSLTASHLRGAPSPARPGPTSTGQELLRGFSQLPEEELHPKPLTKVELELEGALPTTNYANFWIGDQVMLGTMLDEKAQKVTGFVRQPVPQDAKIRVELPDGTYRTFDVRVEQTEEP